MLVLMLVLMLLMPVAALLLLLLLLLRLRLRLPWVLLSSLLIHLQLLLLSACWPVCLPIPASPTALGTEPCGIDRYLVRPWGRMQQFAGLDARSTRPKYGQTGGWRC